MAVIAQPAPFREARDAFRAVANQARLIGGDPGRHGRLVEPMQALLARTDVAGIAEPRLAGLVSSLDEALEGMGKGAMGRAGYKVSHGEWPADHVDSLASRIGEHATAVAQALDGAALRADQRAAGFVDASEASLRELGNSAVAAYDGAGTAGASGALDAETARVVDDLELATLRQEGHLDVIGQIDGRLTGLINRNDGFASDQAKLRELRDALHADPHDPVGDLRTVLERIPVRNGVLD